MNAQALPRTAVGGPDPTVCLTCGRRPERIECHHVAGWRNDPDLIVPLCTACHKIITAWQYAAGIELGEVADGERDPIDAARAVLVGSLLLVELFLRRHPSLARLNRVGADDARLVTRWVSRAWDQAAQREHPGRPGRWTPDPRRERMLDISPSPSDGDPVAMLGEWRRLLDALQDALGIDTPSMSATDVVPTLDLDRPAGSPVIARATIPKQARPVRGIRLADTLTALAELHAAVQTTTDRVLKPEASSPGDWRGTEAAVFTDAEGPLVLAVVASAMRLILATLR